MAPPGISRRELVAAIARWSVPTIVTITLGVRVLEAKVSCPACTKRTGGLCKACAMNAILRCNCEPCLGAPYCTTGTSFQRGGAAVPGSASAPGSQNAAPNPSYEGRRGPLGLPGGDFGSHEDERSRKSSPFNQPTFSDPFATRPLNRKPAAPYTPTRPRTPSGQNSLYDRLRPGANERKRP